MEAIDEVQKLKKLLDEGAITQEEYNYLKQQVLSGNIEKSQVEEKEKPLAPEKTTPNKKKKRRPVFPILALIIVASFSLFLVFKKSGTAVDQDGNKFKTIRIGSQVWMAENLNVRTFRNGDPVPEENSDGFWLYRRDYHSPAWCYYDYNSANGAKYGKLYNWYAVYDPRGLAPEGWHIASREEWHILNDFLDKRHKYEAKALASTKGWLENDYEENVGNNQSKNNRSGFTALPSGVLREKGYMSEGFDNLGELAVWWTSSESDFKEAVVYRFYSHESHLYRDTYLKNSGIAVRCIKD